MFIGSSRVTSQGQISIPAEVRRRMHVRTGTELLWDLRDNGDWVVRPKRYTLEDIQEILQGSDLPRIQATDEELQKARAEFLAHRWKRSEDPDGNR